MSMTDTYKLHKVQRRVECNRVESKHLNVFHRQCVQSGGLVGFWVGVGGVLGRCWRGVGGVLEGLGKCIMDTGK